MRNTTRQEYDTIYKIVMRAQSMGITIGTQVTQVMDIENAHRQFSLDLDGFLNADASNFAHDFCGIQTHMDRYSGRCGNFFLPRFARNESEVK